MDDGGDARLGHPGPEGVEQLVARRQGTVLGERGGRAHDDHPGALGQDPLQLDDRPVGVGQRQVRRTEDAVLVGEAPVLLDPAVEGGERRRQRGQVVLQELLVEHAEGREQPDGLEPELVHAGQAGLGLPVLGADRLPLAEELQRRLPVGVAPEVVVHRPGLGDGVEGGVGDGAADRAAHHVVLPAVDLAPLDAPRRHRRVQVAGEGVEGLVVVVVTVERRVAELCHSVPG